MLTFHHIYDTHLTNFYSESEKKNNHESNFRKVVIFSQSACCQRFLSYPTLVTQTTYKCFIDMLLIKDLNQIEGEKGVKKYAK